MNLAEKLDALWAKFYELPSHSLEAFNVLCAIATVETALDPDVPEASVNIKAGRFYLGDADENTVMHYVNGVGTKREPRYYSTLETMRGKQFQVEKDWIQAMSMFSVSDAAKFAECSVGTISLLATKHNVAMRGGAQFRAERDEIMMQLRDEGVSKAKISRAFGVSPATVSELPKRLSILNKGKPSVQS